MTTYTLTQKQHKFICDVLYGYCFGDEIKAYELLQLLQSLKPNSQEPVGYTSPGKLFDPKPNLAPISKENMVKVLGALEINRVMAQDADGNYTREITPKVVREAITIMQSAIEGMK